MALPFLYVSIYFTTCFTAFSIYLTNSYLSNHNGLQPYQCHRRSACSHFKYMSRACPPYEALWPPTVHNCLYYPGRNSAKTEASQGWLTFVFMSTHCNVDLYMVLCVRSCAGLSGNWAGAPESHYPPVGSNLWQMCTFTRQKCTLVYVHALCRRTFWQFRW
jgi:hypothetical protein